MKKIKKSIFPIMGIVIFSLIFTLIGGNTLVVYNHSDLEFHIPRIEGLSNVFSNPINFKTYNQIGYGINYFYPWLTLYPAICFIKLFHSFSIGYNFYLLVISIITGIIAYFSGKSIFNNRKELKSFVFAILYIFLNYRSLNIYRRFDIGEVLAMAFFPLVIASLYCILIKNEHKGIQLAIGMALVLYSHVLSTVLITIACVMMTILALPQIKNIKFSVIEILKSIGIFLLLSLGFILPFIQQNRLGVTTPFLGNLSDTAISPSNLINNSLNNTIGTDQETIANLGIICIIFLFVGLTNLNKNNLENLFFSLGLIFTLLVTKLFPWQVLPEKAKLLQFPWRFLAIASIFLLFYGISNILDMKGYKIISIVMLLSVVILQISSITSLKSTMKPENIITESKIKDLMNWNNFDYLPQESASKITTIWDHEFYINNKKVDIPFSISENQITIKVAKNYDGENLDLPVLYYIGTYAVNDQGKRLRVQKSERGTIKIKNVEAGTIKITSEYTKLARLGQIVSLITILIIILFKIKKSMKYRL